MKSISRSIYRKYIKELFNKYGHKTYNEEINQQQHANQSLYFSIMRCNKPSHQLACYLHDIGHFVADDRHEANQLGSLDHPVIAYDYLKDLGLPQQVIVPIFNHHLAKKYLCSVEADYMKRLSAPSFTTLMEVGQNMTDDEIKLFQKNPYFKDSVELRRCDDFAKRKDFSDKILFGEKYIDDLVEKLFGNYCNIQNIKKDYLDSV